MKVLFLCPPAWVNFDLWKQVLRELAPDIVAVVPGELPAESLDVAVVLNPAPGVLRTYPNLKAIFSLGAGVEHLFNDPFLPDLPLVKMASPMMAYCMAEFMLYAVLRHHRNFDGCERSQPLHEWKRPHLYNPMASDRKVTVLGLGELGIATAEMLLRHGFNVSGWSRSPKSVHGITCHSGAEGLAAVLSSTEILACLLPLTPQTDGMLNADVFGRLPRGAAVINAGRGKVLVQPDLLEAIDSGHLSGATLDVTDPEPLPPDDPLWHPRVFITSHAASFPPPSTVAPWLIDNLRRLERGEPLLRRVDRRAGY